MRQSFSSAMPETGNPAALNPVPPAPVSTTSPTSADLCVRTHRSGRGLALTPVAPAPAAPIPVALHAVTRVYRSKAGPVTALSGVTASFAAGTFTAVMGPSGSGKSTLLHCAAGLDRPTAGRVFIGGTELTATD